MGTLNDSTYIGVGFMYADGGPNSIYMFISDEGEELGYLQIENEQIGPDITSNQAVDINRINDSLLISSNLFISDFLDDPFGEIVFDATGNIYNLEYRPGTWGSTQMLKTFNNKYIITCGYEYPNSDKDIYLYKINDSLQWDSVYTGDYTYDSLCPLTIQSDTIDLTNCLVFTDVAEIPTAEEFHTSLNSILINVYPNPSNEGVIHLTYQNTDQHDNLELRCYNLFGQEVYWERLYQQQRESIINEADWGKGMYLAVVYKNGTPVGRVKFVLR
jgi:hypothetical protein